MNLTDDQAEAIENLMALQARSIALCGCERIIRTVRHYYEQYLRAALREALAQVVGELARERDSNGDPP